MTASKSRKRPPGSVLVQQSSIAQAEGLLQKLPEKPKEHWSLREAIESLESPIMQALDRGYSHEEVAELLEEQGISISVSSLKRYLAASRKDKGIQPRRTRKPRGSAAAKTTTTDPTSVELSVDEPAPTVMPEADAPMETPTANSRRKRTTSSVTGDTKAPSKAKPRTATRSKATGTPRASTGRRRKVAE